MSLFRRDSDNAALRDGGRAVADVLPKLASLESLDMG